MKNRGSVLIEAISAIFMLTLIISFSISTCIKSNQILKERILREELNRAMYNTINELKYNTKMNDLKEILDYNYIGLKFDENFYDELMNKDILNLTKGSDIKISKLKEDNYKLEILIDGVIDRENLHVDIKQSFTKMWWMEYV
ncbi:hypothetical protein BGI42_09385 [Clostridium taeniosporum]|uniref:Uncharacterized protein n=1 Tax=Clostridium taeniosporum TaxID=394958 RepID=A0A1D7XNQ4_9CLOT|nr:hypothetical protein BGI42_09385 [Clostridium taeniosporum]